MNDIAKPTDLEMLASLARVSAEYIARALQHDGQLARDVVTELVARGLALRQDGQDVQRFQASADHGDYETMEQQYKAALAQIGELTQQLRDANEKYEKMHAAWRRTQEELANLQARTETARVRELAPDEWEDVIEPDSDSTDEIPLPLKPKPSPTCQTCVRWAGGVCRSTKSLKANTHTGAGDSCACHFPREKCLVTPEPIARPAPKTPVRTLRPRGTCKVCGGTFVVCLSGMIQRHDADGVAYYGGRGDRNRVCLGSGKAPK
jgi:hypothetical protein